jgi:hypothetical protein
MMATLAQATLPTARVIRWWPLVGTSALLLSAALLTAASDRPGDLLLVLASAALASLVVGALHDPARMLLEPVPVSAMQRRVLRIALTGGAALVVWAVLTLLLTESSGIHEVGPLVALTSVGVAVAVWAPARSCVLLGAVIPVLLFSLGQAVPGDGPVSEVATLWHTDPWPVAAVALTACFLGRTR